MKRIGVFLLCFVAVLTTISAQNTFMGNTGTTGVENGYEWMDLGLPSGLKWATCNVGATSPKKMGCFFLWGDIEPAKDYYSNSERPYKYMVVDSTSYRGITKYTVPDGDLSGIWYDVEGSFIGDNKTVLDPEDDAVTCNMGYPWRMPTKEDFLELKDRCTWKRTKCGYKIIGPNGNSIFLPVLGGSWSYMSSSLSDKSCCFITLSMITFKDWIKNNRPYGLKLCSRMPSQSSFIAVRGVCTVL